MQGWAACAQLCQELERSERERDRRSKNMRVDSQATMGFKCGAHVRMHRRTQWKQSIDRDSVTDYAKRKGNKRDEASMTHNVALCGGPALVFHRARQ